MQVIALSCKYTILSFIKIVNFLLKLFYFIVDDFFSIPIFSTIIILFYLNIFRVHVDVMTCAFMRAMFPHAMRNEIIDVKKVTS
jgi:hypothetical protein